jgi:hypothetical protein
VVNQGLQEHTKFNCQDKFFNNDELLIWQTL